MGVVFYYGFTVFLGHGSFYNRRSESIDTACIGKDVKAVFRYC